MKKIVWIFIVILCLVGCSNKEKNVKSLSPDEVAEYVGKSQSILENFYGENFSAMKDEMSKEMNEALKEEDLKNLLTTIKDKGEFLEFGEADAVIYYDEKTDKEYKVTQQEVDHEKGKYIFTLNYDEDGKLAGFFYK